MRKPMIFLMVLGMVATIAVMGVPSSAGEDARGFVGVGKCKTCHKSEAQGEQYPIWLEGPHAKAFEVLGTAEAKALAKEKGIDDPQTADACLKCHVTAHGVAAELLGTKYLATDGVGCESCHGAGADYYKKKTMVAITTGEIEAASVGLVKPNEKTCVACHNEESPTFKGFDFEKMSAKIAHTIPAERMEKYK